LILGRHGGVAMLSSTPNVWDAARPTWPRANTTPARVVPSVIRARSNRDADIAAAFTQQQAYARPGPWGPGPLPVVIIPGSTAIAPPAPGQIREVVEPRPVARPPAKTDPRETIRRSRFAIGGYATFFDIPSSWGADAIQIRRGAFREACAGREQVCYLLIDHPEAGAGPSLASTGHATTPLYLEEDARGLWFEAALPDDARGAQVFHQSRDCTGVSWSGGVGAMQESGGVKTYGVVRPWEISLLRPPAQPRFRGTWARSLAYATQRRTYF